MDELRLGVAEALWATVPRSRNDGLNARLSLPDAINAPVAAGETLGTLQVVLGEEVVAERPLVALEPVEQGGLFKRLLDTIRQFISGFFN